MKEFFAKALAYLKSLKPLTILKELAKPALLAAVRKESEHLRIEAQRKVALEGPGALDKVFDRWQFKLIQTINMARFVPESFREQVCKAIQEEGDKLQSKAKDALVKGGSEALDAVFVGVEIALSERIRAL